VLRNGKWTSLQNKNAVTAGRVLGKEMLGADSAEGSSADDNHVEHACVRLFEEFVLARASSSPLQM